MLCSLPRACYCVNMLRKQMSGNPIQHPVWFPGGSHMDVAFAGDLKIRALNGFVRDVAADLALGKTLASAARSAASRYPVALESFDLTGSDALIEERFALNESLTFPNEPLPETIR